MIVHRIVCLCLFFFIATLLPGTANSHGGVVEEDDLCVIKVNFLRAHFKVYQPETSGLKQFCEDMPAAEESVFVMEYQHDSLAEMEVDFRIIQDVTGKGRFARLEDVERIPDLNAVTVYYQSPVVQPDVYSVVHRFAEEGEFVGIVSARHKETGKLYTAVFPFEVGFIGIGYWPFIVGLVVLLQLQFLIMSGRLKKWFSRPAAAAAIVMLAFAATSPVLASDYIVTFTSDLEPLQINRMHSWVLHVRDESGKPVEGASIEVEGGMPEHDHGLPTRPRVTASLGNGDYKIDGMRFHMNGQWEIFVHITTDSGTSTVVVPLTL